MLVCLGWGFIYVTKNLKCTRVGNIDGSMLMVGYFDLANSRAVRVVQRNEFTTNYIPDYEIRGSYCWILGFSGLCVVLPSLFVADSAQLIGCNINMLALSD